MLLTSFLHLVFFFCRCNNSGTTKRGQRIHYSRLVYSQRSAAGERRTQIKMRSKFRNFRAV